MAQDDFLTFIERIKQAESRGQRYGKDGKLLTSPKGAQGEMQVMPATQRAPGFGVAPVKDNSPDEIARVGRDILRAFDAKYGGNRMYIAAAYNWGPGNADKWIAAGADFNKLPEETQKYLRKVVPEALTASRDQKPAPRATAVTEPAVMEPPLGISASAGGRTIAIGDSLAVGFAQANKLDGLHKGGAGPKAVLKMVQDYAANNSLEGVTVYLGTGLPNNPAQRDFVTKQVDLIKSKGGIPVLFGAGPGSEKTPTTGQNEFLQSVAQSTGAQFTGPLADRFPNISKQDRTGLHLTHPQYRQLFSQMGGAAPAASRPAAASPAPGATSTATAPAAPAAVAAAPVARAEDLGSGYKAALALSFLGSEDRDRPAPDSELEDRLNETALAEFNKELEDYTPKNALADVELTALNPAKFMQPVKMADGGEVDSGEMLFSKGNTPAGNSAPPRFAAQELEAFIKAANPGATVLEYERGPGDALGFVHSKMPDVLNIKKSQTPGTKEQTMLHELEHSLDARGGDILGRPDIAGMDNNFRAYHLMNNDWRPIEKFVSSVIQNKDKLRDFFGQDIVSGYITMDPETFKKLKIRDKDRALFAEQIASLSALEQATGKSLTRDPEMRKIFPNTQMMAVYDALTGLRQTRTDARDLPPHTPLPSYMYETNPVTRFIREKTTGPNEYGIPIKRAGGSPETGEVAPTPEELDAASRPYVGNPNIARQGAAARALAAQRDVNTLPDPRTYAAVSGFFGQAPDELGFSVMHPDIKGITTAGEAGYAAGLVPAVAPVVAPIARAVKKGATALGMRAEKALDAPVTRTLEGGGRSAEMLRALGAQPSFAVRPKGGHFELRPDASGPGMAVWDDVKQTVSDLLANTKDQPLNNWFNTKYATYLRRDFAAEGDPFVKAADAGKKLHIPNQPLDENWQKTLNFVRKNEGLPPQGFATTEYGKRVEDSLDASLNIRELGDLAGSPYSLGKVPSGIMQFANTNPQMRIYSLDEIMQSGPRAESLRNTMLEMRQPSVSYYGESIAIPKNYQLTNETLQGLTPVQASERAALFSEWKDTARQKAATLSVRKNKDISKQDAGDGYLWVNPPDLSANPKIRQMVQDVGCDGGWCTREERWALDYGSGNSRLSFLIDNKNRPVAQMTIEDLGSSDPLHLRKKFIKSLSPQEIGAFRSNPLYKHIQDDELYLFADSFPQYDQYIRNVPPRISITEIKAKGNKEDVVNHVSSTDLKKIHDQIKYLDTRFDLQYVKNLRNTGLVEAPRNRPDTILNRFNPTMETRDRLKAKFGGEMEGFQAVLDRAININGGSRYFSGNEDEISDIFQKAARDVLRNEAQNIMFNSFLPRAKGGMVERQSNDNRAYL